MNYITDNRYNEQRFKGKEKKISTKCQDTTYENIYHVYLRHSSRVFVVKGKHCLPSTIL